MKKRLTLYDVLEILRRDSEELGLHVYAPYDMGAITVCRLLRDKYETAYDKTIKTQNLSRYWDCSVQTLYVDANFVRIELFTDEVLEIYNTELEELYHEGKRD